MTLISDHATRMGTDIRRVVRAATVTTSLPALQLLFGFPDHALIDMGDFVGGTLKYLRRHPVARLTLAGGFAKMAKLAAGHLDLHSSKSRVEPALLSEILAGAGADDHILAVASGAGSAGAFLESAAQWRAALATGVARRAREVALATLSGATVVEVAIVDRTGELLAMEGA